MVLVPAVAILLVPEVVDGPVVVGVVVPELMEEVELELVGTREAPGAFWPNEPPLDPPVAPLLDRSVPHLSLKVVEETPLGSSEMLLALAVAEPGPLSVLNMPLSVADVPANVTPFSDFLVGLPLLVVCSTFVSLVEGTISVLVKSATFGSVTPSVASLPLPVKSMPVAPALSVSGVAPVASELVCVESSAIVQFTVVLLVDSVLRVCANGP